MFSFDTRHIGPMVLDACSLVLGSAFRRPARRGLVQLGRDIRRQAFEAQDAFPTISLPALLDALGASEPLSIALPPVGNLTGNTIGDVKPYYYVGALAAGLKPAVSFEFGTYLGLSALAIALNTPEDSVIYTVDLPDGAAGDDTKTLTRGDCKLVEQAAGIVGRGLAHHPAARKVRQIRCNSFDIDVAAYASQIDFAFIDGGHSYELVKNDTEKCLPLLRKEGLIVWDDYTWNLPGVLRYLNGLRATMPLKRIVGTQYVVCSDLLA